MKIAITNDPQELSTFVRNALTRLTPTSSITIKHSPNPAADAEVESAVITPELLRLLEAALRKNLAPTPHETYLPGPTVARMLGIKTATLSKWRRQGRGPKGAVRTSATSVSYPVSEVDSFMKSWSKGGDLHADPSNRLTPVQPGLKWDRRSKTAFFDARSPSGKRIRRVLPFDSVASAKAAFPAFRADVKGGRYDRAAELEDGAGTTDSATPMPVAPQIVSTFREYVAAHWKSINAKCSDSTERSNRNSLNAHLLPFFGDMVITCIDEASCEDFGLYMKEKHRAAPTVNFALRLLRKVLHHARRRKVIAYDAMPENFHFLKETMLKLEMNDSEQDAFVASFDDEAGFREDLNARQKRSGKIVRSPRFGFKERRFGGGLKSDSEAAGIYFERFRQSRLIFFAALDLGLSETDLRLLKRSSVDLTNGRVEVVRSKTKKVATIALSDRCRAAIVEALSQPITSNEYVFTTETGKPYSESTLRRYFAIAKRLAGITRRCRLTDLRHTFASNLINDGIPSIVVRDALGHADVRMTQRYAKPSAHALEQMRASLNRRGQRAIMPDAEAGTSKDGRA